MKPYGPRAESIDGFSVDDQAAPSRAPGSLAKITMPSVSRSYPRERLFREFDALGAYQVMWLSAPAGYGKTTSVASYLRARGRRTVWYQCDTGDADIASFFHYIALARERLELSEGASLPAFQPPYFSAVPTFARNFFRGWFAHLPGGTALVLDNWQEVPSDSALSDALPVIAEQLPQGVRLVVISRGDPPANCSRLLASERMAVVDVHALQFSKAETIAVAELQASFAEGAQGVDIEEMYAVTQGWPAGLTLMMRHARTHASTGTLGGSLKVIFDYLAAEVFDRLDEPVQRLLLDTACLEYVSAPVASRLSGRADAAGLLDGLARQNAFTVYRPAADSYHYHPLFQEFLRGRVVASLTAREHTEWLIRASHALSAEGDSEAAIGLLLQAHAWHEAASLMRSVAPILVQQARLKTLLGWLDQLPAETLAVDSWLVYWRGVCQLTTEFPSARATLEQSYQAFATEGDRLGQMLASASILQHITYCYADYRPMLPWIEALERLLAESPSFPSQRVELQIRSGFMLALSQALPQHPSLVPSVERVSALVASERNLATRAEGVSALLHFFARFGRTAQYADLDAQVDDILNDRRLEPVNRLHLMWLHAYQLHSSGDTRRVLGILADARTLARHEGLAGEDARMRVCELQAGEIEPPAATAIATFSELEPSMRTAPPIALAHFLYVRALFELACGHMQEALKYGEESIPLIRASHWHIGEALSLTGMAEIYCAAGRYEDAARCIRECDELTAGVEAPLLDFNTHLVRAEIARNTGRPAEFSSQLARAFSVGRQQGYANGFHTGSQLLKNLLPHALRLGIETSYCCWVIGKRNFKPPSAALSQWPWRIRIRALGRLEVTVGGVPLRFAGKAQRKPLDLLKILVGHGQGLEISGVMDMLWPDLDGDSARNALDLSLHRLRKLLGSADSVLLADRRIGLNGDVVWADTFAIERMSAEDCSPEELPSAVEELLDLYRAPLLSGDDGPVAIVAARDRLRSQFLRTATKLAQQLAASRQWEQLSSLCVRAIEMEPLEERLHHDLIRSLQAQGHTTQAQLAYKRCERVLAQALIGAPSASTRRLVQTEREGRQP